MEAIEKKWYSIGGAFGKYILAGDIGGTHTNMALFGEESGKLTMVYKCVYPTQEISEFRQPFAEVLDEIKAREHSLMPSAACISVAGPAHDNYCKLTNATWAVDGHELERLFGIETRVVNDFLALSYAIPLLDLSNRDEVVALPHPDGSRPVPGGEIMAVVGAGTGLGTGFLVRHDDDYRAYPTEGGHADFSPHDEQTAELKAFVDGSYPYAAGTEPFLAGRGIANIYAYLKSQGMGLHGVLAEIDALPETEKPARISQEAATNEECRRIMELYLSIYARYAARAALMYLPTGGLFIAGGIAAKNLSLFLDSDHFMRVFESSYKENIHSVLKTIPVYIVLNYSISLYGAANAARILSL